MSCGKTNKQRLTYVGLSLKAFKDVIGASKLIVEQVQRLLVNILVSIADKKCPVIQNTKTRNEMT